MRIGIDLMGSDSSPKALFDGVLRAAEQLDPSSSLVVIATHSIVNDLKKSPEIKLLPILSARIEFHPVSDSITMADDPVQAVSQKKGSSIVVGIRLLKKQAIDAFVTTGNTGALITAATLQLPHLPGIKRPALLVALPTVAGSVAVLDVGGNVLCKAHHLVQFAQMGAAYQSCSEGIPIPTVGLLNIGVEPKKGTSSVREAYKTLTNYCEKSTACGQRMIFAGNVEGRDLFNGKIDVLVTDGFSGNVLLKTAEGVSSFIFDYLQESVNSTDQMQEAFQKLRRFFSHAEYPGAFVCGVEGIVIKCHGNSSARAVCNGIKGAATLIKANVIARIKEALTANPSFEEEEVELSTEHNSESAGDEAVDKKWTQMGLF